MSPPHRPHPAAFLLVPLLFATILVLFAWPNAEVGPRDLPVAVAGPPARADALEQRLGGRPEAFDVRRYADEAAARDAIEDREVYGAFVATADGAKALTASAASAPVAQVLAAAAADAGAPVEDVVAASPRAAALPSSVLPLVIGGILTGVAALTLATSRVRLVGLLLGGSVLAGVAATALVQGWLDVVGGDWAANAAGLSLTVLAIAATVAGLASLLGRAGIALGALTMVFVGNPFSGVGPGPHMLPEPAGAIGQLLPPGAGGNLLRSTGFFDGAAAGGHAAVLAVWALAGLGLVGVAAARVRRASAPSADPARA